MITTCEYGDEIDCATATPKVELAPEVPAIYNALLPHDVPWFTPAGPLGHSVRPIDQKQVSADEALSSVRSGQRVYIGGNCGEPIQLVQALMRRGQALRNVEIIHALTIGEAPYAEPEEHGENSRAFRPNVFFVSQNMRAAVDNGTADFTPICLGELPRLFRDGSLKLDVALISVSLPDAQGFCNYGVEVGITKPAAENARLVIAELNPNMPRVWGDSFIHISQIDYCVPVDYRLPEVKPIEPTPIHAQIGEFVADLIEDGATLQVGSGAIPNAVLRYLGDKHDLGVHTEMFSDGVVDLVEAGVITGRCKTFLPGKIVGSFVRGTQRLYDFVRNNPVVELHPIDFTNDRYVIAKNDKMVAIDSALQIDLTGQVCADSIGHHLYGGVGGQADFIRGAALSRGGKPIIALPSTALGGEVSRIVGTLEPGAGVTVTRSDVHYVVTEYGVASLYGKTLRQRATELINIAHPDFRAELHAVATNRRLF